MKCPQFVKKQLRRWLPASSASTRPVFYMADPPPEPRPIRPWTGEGSQTEYEILYHLQFGPMTRRQLNDILDVTTTGLLLPSLVDRHKIRIVKGTWPFRYELTDESEALRATGEPV